MKARTSRALFAAIVAIAGRAAARLTDCGRGGRGIRGRGSDCRRGGRGIRVSLFAVGVAVFTALSQPAQAQTTDIAVLHSRVDNIDATIARMDDKFTKRFERVDERLDRIEANIVEIKENGARPDEKVSALQMQNQFIVIPLLLLLVATMFGLLTKGTYWGVERKPKAAAASRPAQTPPQQFHPS